MSTESDYAVTSDEVIAVRWAAPELLSNPKFSFKTDVFAFAITMHEIYNNANQPYWQMRNVEVMEFVKAGKRLDLSKNIPKEIQQLIQQCWDQDTSKRPNFPEISKLLKEIENLQ